MPSIPELTEPLTDGALVLRQAAERDIPETLIAHQDDLELYKRLGLERPPSGAELGRHSERARAEREAGTHVALTVTEPGSDVCVGCVSLNKVDWANSRGELGLWLAPQVRGRGLAPRALRLACGWLFERCSLQRLQVVTEADNEAMIAAARAAGFTFEGVLRGFTFERGHRVDCAVLSLLPADLAR